MKKELSPSPSEEDLKFLMSDISLDSGLLIRYTNFLLFGHVL